MKWLRFALTFAGVLLLGVSFSVGAAPAAGTYTDEECAEFGRRIADFFEAGQAGEVVQLLDKFALADRISTGLGFNADEERDFRVGLLESLSQGLAKQFSAFTS